MTMRQKFIVFAVIAPPLVFGISLYWPPINWLFVLLLPVILLGIVDMLQTGHTIRRLYPVLGNFRYLLESVRTEIQQYFVESETSGAPIPREFRTLIYQRAKGDRDTRPFGTIFDVNRAGYEWMNHSLAPKHATNTVNSARGMMLALGCVQSRTCNTDECPTGIATQNPSRSKGLVVANKATRVANFHESTIETLMELVAAAGLDGLEKLSAKDINRRVQGNVVKTYAQLYPNITDGCLLSLNTIPKEWMEHWQSADPRAW